MGLEERLEEIGRSLGEREAAHVAALDAARDRAIALRQRVAVALDRFHRAATTAGAPHLQIEIGEVRLDEKHLRAVEFDLRRGKHRAIVTAKSRGDLMLVGPFRMGKTEGPCRSFPFDAEKEVASALEDLLVRFIEEAAAP